MFPVIKSKKGQLLVAGTMVLATLAALLFVLVALVIAGHTPPGTIFVDASVTTVIDGTEGTVGNEFSTIQAAVTHASAGDTISVAAGTYTGGPFPDLGQTGVAGDGALVVIDKSLTLIGEPTDGTPGLTLNNHPILNGGAQVGNGFTIKAGVSNVTIEGFEVTNFAQGTGLGGQGSAVFAWGLTSITNVTVRDNHFHDTEGNGVLVGNEGQVLHSGWTVQDNLIKDTTGTAPIELTNTSNSTVTGNDISVTAASNAIGIVIDAQSHSGTSPNPSTVTVSNNTFTGPFGRAIFLLSIVFNGTGAPVLSNVTVGPNNQVIDTTTNSIRGVWLRTLDLVGSGNPTTSNLTIDSNTLDGYEDAVQITEGGGPHGTITITNNQIINSTGSSSGIHVTSGTSAANITASNNTITNNNLLGINNEGTGTLNAENNWWGAADGPGGPAGPGSGDGVSTNVDFDPWIASVSLTPASETKTTGQTFSITATLKDNTGTAVASSGLTARFTRTGASVGTADVAFTAGGTAVHNFTAVTGTTSVTAQPLFAGSPGGPISAAGAYTGVAPPPTPTPRPPPPTPAPTPIPTVIPEEEVTLVVPPPGGVSGIIQPTEAATLAAPDGNVLIDVPLGATSVTIQLGVTPLTPGEVPGPPGDITFTESVFSIEVSDVNAEPQPGFRFDKFLSITVQFGSDDLTRVNNDISRIVILRFEESSQQWIILPTTVDPAELTATFPSSRFSLFALGLVGVEVLPTPISEAELIAKRAERPIPPSLVDNIFCNLFGVRCQ